MKKKNYDLLWKWGVPYLFVSIYLESGYKKIDAISYNENGTNHLFISKNSRKKLSKEGYLLYTSGFEAFRKRALQSMTQLERYLKDEKKYTIPKFSDNKFIDGFEKMIMNLRKSWIDYFPTEIHHVDLVAHKIETGSVDAEMRLLKKNLNRMGRLRQKQRDVINRIMYAPGPFYQYTQEAAKRLGENILDYDYQTVVSKLQGKKITRKNFTHIILGRFGHWKPMTGRRAQMLFKQLLPINTAAKELKGVIANKGFYMGHVRKIEFDLKTDFDKEISQMKKGEVLVSGSTGPEMILACKKAGAIVTEEGGLLSHAAIVSRELKIPCIVGTKIATIVLQTGDLVEVDANKGIVKKI